MKVVSLKALLLGLPVLAVLPVLVYAAFLLKLSAHQAQDAARVELAAGAHAMGIALQRDLEQAMLALSLLASSPGIDEQGRIDEERLQSLAARLAGARFGLRSFILVRPDGTVDFAYPAHLVPGGHLEQAPHHQDVLARGAPVLSGLHASRIDGQPAVSVNMPVRRGGQVRWVLSARLSPAHLADTMAAHLGQRDAIGTLLDPQLQITARTQQMDTFFNRRPSPQTLTALAGGPAGMARFRTLDGNELLWAWTTLPGGWKALVGTPARTLDETLRRSMGRLALAGLVVLGVSLLLSSHLAGRIARSVDDIADNAHRLVEGGRSSYRPTGIRQVDALYRDIEKAMAMVVNALASERAARTAADEHNRAKDVFIALLSHELRNPLAPIRTAARVLQSPRAPEDRKRWAVDVIDRQAGTMARLLDDLLDISRVSRGRIELRLQRVQMQQVLEDAAEVARPLVEERQLALTLHPPPRPIELDADPLRLTQVFGNLLTNAAKYTPPGGRIDVDTALHDGAVEVSVRDTGIGLAADSLDAVFGMFTQVRGARESGPGGLGIGLALVRGLVELHGGRVSAASPGLGHGATFRVMLPCCSAPEPGA